MSPALCQVNAQPQQAMDMHMLAMWLNRKEEQLSGTGMYPCQATDRFVLLTQQRRARLIVPRYALLCGAVADIAEGRAIGILGHAVSLNILLHQSVITVNLLGPSDRVTIAGSSRPQVRQDLQA